MLKEIPYKLNSNYHVAIDPSYHIYYKKNNNNNGYGYGGYGYGYKHGKGYGYGGKNQWDEVEESGKLN